MNANATRRWMIVLLAVAAVVSVVGKKLDEPWIGWLSFVAFLGAVFLYVDWRRRLAAQRRAARVFDREAKTDETGPRPDQ